MMISQYGDNKLSISLDIDERCSNYK